MELSEGYKLTEIGVIPKDWAITKLDDLIDESRSIRYGIVQPGKFDSSGRYMVRGQDYSTGWVTEEQLFKVSSLIEEKYKNARLKVGDLVLTIVGASTGHLEQVPNWLDGANITQTTARIPISNQRADSRYCLYYLKSKYGQKQVFNFIKGAAQPGLNIGDIRTFKVITPPLHEQTAIATALSDMDALIAQTEKLIEKKKAIKQGMMQRLLYPCDTEGRLKEGWMKKRLGDILTIRHGKDQKPVQESNGPFPVLGTGGLMGYAKTYIYDKPSVLIGRKGTINKPQYMDSPFWTVDTLFYSEIFFDNYPKYIFYQFLLIDWGSYNEASGVPSLNAKTIENIEIEVPPYQVQVSISEILTQIDFEIRLIKQKFEKLQFQKQGMMQSLLTGKIRIYKPQHEPTAAI